MPEPVKRRISILRDENRILRKEILRYYTKIQNVQDSSEIKEVINYMKKNPVSVFPYKFQEFYSESKAGIQIFTDQVNGLKYVLLNNEKLYFKRKLSDDTIRIMFSALQMEQDKDSPHKYITRDFGVEERSVVADIGAAEGMFSLSVIKKASKVYLFESDPEWIGPLQATFEPFKEKVEIINKYVSDKNEGNNITLDRFFQNKEYIDFLKLDVEGSENAVLEGSKNMLLAQNLKIALCTYHQKDDAKVYKDLLEKSGFNVSFSRGYMIFLYSQALEPPYLRKALIRASK
jgi:hypothetical protein